jgi:hypothetical protein
MLTRRELVQSALAFGAWPVLRSLPAKALPGNSGAAPDDEAFWGQVRSQFEWERESSNLVTVVRGISPKHVRELAVGRATELNSLEITKVMARIGSRACEERLRTSSEPRLRTWRFCGTRPKGSLQCFRIGL